MGTLEDWEVETFGIWDLGLGRFRNFGFGKMAGRQEGRKAAGGTLHLDFTSLFSPNMETSVNPVTQNKLRAYVNLERMCESLMRSRRAQRAGAVSSKPPGFGAAKRHKGYVAA